MLAVGTQLGRYEIVAPLGKGGMGEVYRAKDARLGREVAVKVLPEHFATDPVRLARFEREARAVAALSHPNLLAIHDYGTEAGVTFLVMELLDGESLRARLARSPLSWRQAAEVGAAIADGLAAAHAKGIVHRDLKPDNLFLTPDGRVKVLDFGLALVESPPPTGTETGDFVPPLTESGTVMGTVGYMSPEQARGRPVDARSDLFSLGCVLFEMMAGRSPFRRGTSADTLAAILHEPPPALADLGRPAPAAVEAAILRCLAKSADDRYATARELASALRALGGSQQVPPSEVTAPHILEAEAVPVTAATEPRPAETVTSPEDPRPAKRGWLRVIVLLLACVLLPLLLCVAPTAGLIYLAVNFVANFPDMLKDGFERQHQWDEVARFWRPPPADAGPEALFPARVKEYERISHDKKADIPEWKLQAPGRRAVYRLEKAQVEVFVWRATKLEKEALVRRAHDVLWPKEDRNAVGGTGKTDKGGYRSVLGSAEGTFLSYSAGPGSVATQHGIFWWDRDWLFLARSATVRDPGAFLKDYLAALGAKD